MVQRKGKNSKSLFLLFMLIVFFFSSCSRFLGYGVLLWSTEEPAMPSGIVLPVHIKSNIDKVWVVGIPKEYRAEDDRIGKFEIPLSKLEMVGSKKKAIERAQAFSPYALMYAETLQDGLPIREHPDNGARRVYRLKLGEIIKILEQIEGVVAVGTTGDPLPGDWYEVLTEDGTIGYCFSYRLKLFDHLGGLLAAAVNEQTETEDPVLERLLERNWSPEIYFSMINSGKIDLDELSRHWGFDPGLDTGTARVKIRELDRSFTYTRIRSTGTQSWHFEGTPLQMNLRSESTLAIQFTEGSGIMRTILFVALQSEIEDIILQESARREAQYKRIFSHGPVYTSNNYGTLILREDGSFNWNGYMLLAPQVIPASAIGSGSVDMRLYLSNTLNDRYDGAFTLNFDGLSGSGLPVNFMYSQDSQGLRLEYVPLDSLDGITVAGRASSPMVIYFFRSDDQDGRSGMNYPAPLTVPDGQSSFSDNSYFNEDPFQRDSYSDNDSSGLFDTDNSESDFFD